MLGVTDLLFNCIDIEIEVFRSNIKLLKNFVHRKPFVNHRVRGCSWTLKSLWLYSLNETNIDIDFIHSEVIELFIDSRSSIWLSYYPKACVWYPYTLNSIPIYLEVWHMDFYYWAHILYMVFYYWLANMAILVSYQALSYRAHILYMGVYYWLANMTISVSFLIIKLK